AFDAILVLRTFVVGRAVLLGVTDALPALGPRRAVLVGGTGPAAVAQAFLAGRALRLVLAVAGDLVAAAAVAGEPFLAVGGGAALLALAGHAKFLLCGAILVGLAIGIVGRTACPQRGEREGDQRD